MTEIITYKTLVLAAVLCIEVRCKLSGTHVYSTEAMTKLDNFVRNQTP